MIKFYAVQKSSQVRRLLKHKTRSSEPVQYGSVDPGVSLNARTILAIDRETLMAAETESENAGCGGRKDFSCSVLGSVKKYVSDLLKLSEKVDKSHSGSYLVTSTTTTTTTTMMRMMSTEKG